MKEIVLAAVLILGGVLVIVGSRVAAGALSTRKSDEPPRTAGASTMTIVYGLAAAAIGAAMLAGAYLEIESLPSVY